MTFFINDNGVDREMTPQEIETHKATQKQTMLEEKARIEALQTLAAAKISARAKLKALGLTDDEIAALVG